MSKNDAIPENRGEINSSVAGQISQTIQAGLPLESGLRALAEQTRSLSVKTGLQTLAARLEQGIPLARAIQDTTLKLPRAMRALVSAGIETGRIDALMKYSIGQQQRSIYLKQQIWLSFAYPLFILWLAIFYCLGVLQFIMPKFKKMFDDFGTQLPELTRILIGLSDFVVNYLAPDWNRFVFVLGILVLSACMVYVWGSRTMQRNASLFPLIGRMFRFAALSDFCQVLSLLIESGLPFSSAIKLAGIASNDAWIATKCETMSQRIDEGASADDAARQVRLPNTVVQIMHNVVSQESFVKGLRGLSDIYAARSFLQTRLVTSMFAPFAIAVVVFFVGLCTLAMFMPMITLLNALS